MAKQDQGRHLTLAPLAALEVLQSRVDADAGERPSPVAGRIPFGTLGPTRLTLACATPLAAEVQCRWR
jgi:hypothetical protein